MGKRPWHSGYRFGVGNGRFKVGLGSVTGKDRRQRFKIDGRWSGFVEGVAVTYGRGLTARVQGGEEENDWRLGTKSATIISK